MKHKDIFLLIIIIIVIIILFIVNNIVNREEIDIAEIYINNKLYKSISIDLDEDIIINNDNNYNHIKIHNGGVEMIESSCSDKICVKSGHIKKVSDRIVCMPNKVVIKIKGTDTSKEDVISE